MSRRVFTPEQDKEVAGLYQAGYSTRKIAEIYHCEKSAVSNALEREGTNRRTNRDLTDSEESQILKIYQAGYSIPRITRAYNKSETLVHGAIIRQGGKLRDDRFNFCEAEEKEIIKIYLANNSMPAIAKTYGCMIKAVRGVLVRNNISLRKTTLNFVPKPKKVKLPRVIKSAIGNQNAFDVLNTEESLYWLGFCYADADTSKYQLRIGLSIKDLEHVKSLSRFLGGQPESIRVRQTHCATEFTSRHLVNRLTGLGIVPKRGKFENLAREIPDGMEHHFIRGYIDGDGCISDREKIIILGQVDILTWIKGMFVKYIGASDKVEPRQRRGILEIAWGGRIQFHKLIDYIYKDATIYLERKRAIADKTKKALN